MEPLLDLLLGALTDLKENTKGRKKDIYTHIHTPIYIYMKHTYIYMKDHVTEVSKVNVQH